MLFRSESHDQVRESFSAPFSQPTALYYVHFFGPFRIYHKDSPLGEPLWRRNKAKTLLKWFLLNPGRLYSADQLVKMFWSNRDGKAAARDLHVAIHYIRRLLEPALSSSRQEPRYLRRNKNNFYWLEIDNTWWIDTLELQRLYASAKRLDQKGHVTEAILSYRKIAQYYNLGFLPEDMYEDVFYPFRHQHDSIYAQILERLSSLAFRLSMFDEVLIYSHQALSVDPYNEAAIQAIVKAHVCQGNVVKAIKELNDFLGHLTQESGIQPSDEIRALRRQLEGLCCKNF